MDMVAEDARRSLAQQRRGSRGEQPTIHHTARSNMNAEKYRRARFGIIHETCLMGMNRWNDVWLDEDEW